MSPKSEIPALSSENIRKIGRALGGTHWQADVARHQAMEYSKSMITRVLGGTRKADGLFAQGLRDVMLDKIKSVAELLDCDGLPDARSPSTKKAKAMVLEALELLRGSPAKNEGMRDQKFKIAYSDDEGDHVQELLLKGQAFAVAKRRAKKITGPKVEVTRYVAIPPREVDPKRDVQENRCWWRPVRRWDFYPDGDMKSHILGSGVIP